MNAASSLPLPIVYTRILYLSRLYFVYFLVYLCFGVDFLVNSGGNGPVYVTSAFFTVIIIACHVFNYYTRTTFSANVSIAAAGLYVSLTIVRLIVNLAEFANDYTSAERILFIILCVFICMNSYSIIFLNIIIVNRIATGEDPFGQRVNNDVAENNFSAHNVLASAPRKSDLEENLIPTSATHSNVPVVVATVVK